jgi:hypothetical protein
MRLIWATRGRTWGFRFLCDGGAEDPLPVYEDVFSGVEDESRVWRRVADKGALRFPDPKGRRDVAGRAIPHDFVVFRPLADEIESVEDGFRRVWPLVEDKFDQVWKGSKPPSANS